jgi:Asp-tRNA(Asn)/Glu-tRNA(Gln) amidotransferase A subunit family amidase
LPPGSKPNVDSSERVAAALDRIDPGLGAFITLDSGVVEAAQRDPGGRLRGIILGVKDLFDTAALRTTYGSIRHLDHVPSQDASLVATMRQEGALVLGKTNLNEYAYGVSGLNPHFGAMLSPADRSRTAGGSSGGSAIAVATGVCDLALGTDTSGSVRIPAACCNVYGFKLATWASQMAGVFPLAPSLDSVGLFAPDIATLERALNVKRWTNARALRIGRLGEDVFPPDLPSEHWVLFRSEAHAIHRDNARREPASFGSDVLHKLDRKVGDVVGAQAVLRGWRASFEAAISGIDILESDVFAGEAPTLDAVMRDYHENTLHESRRLMAFTPVANALGWPAMTVPTANRPRHLLARPGNEAAMLAHAAAIGLDRADVLSAAAG